MRSMTTANERLEDLRLEKGLKQSELAEETGIPSSTLSDYEQEGALIPHTVVSKLADYYGVSADYLIGRTDIREPEDKELAGTHLTDKAYEVLKRDDINSRLISEIIEHPDFRRFMIDANILIDDFVNENLSLFRAGTEAKVRAAYKADPLQGEYEERMYGHLWDVMSEYYVTVLVKDLMPILEDIKKAHRSDPETSNGPILTADMMENLKSSFEAVETKDEALHELSSTIASVIKVKGTEANIDNVQNVLISNGQDTKAIEDMLSRSELIEPNARKRRRK